MTKKKTLLQRVKALVAQKKDCWIWKGLTSRGPMPVIHIGNSNVSARRRLYQEITKTTLTQGQIVKTSCGDKLCMNPAHFVVMTTQEARAVDAAKGSFNTLKMQVTRLRTTRARAKLTMDIAREIRASEDDAGTLAKKYGVHRKQINLIRQGKAWQEVASPFSGLFTGLSANTEWKRRA